jgi:hypothetical protein
MHAIRRDFPDRSEHIRKVWLGYFATWLILQARSAIAIA